MGDARNRYRQDHDRLYYTPARPTDPYPAVNLATARDCIGRTFEGYKGGDYQMSADTPVWIHTWGTTAGSGRIVGIEVNEGVGQFVIAAGGIW